MSQEFRRPSFLHKEIQPRPFSGDEFREGSLTTVAQLEDLPSAIKERAKGGLVVKEYRYSEGDPAWDALLEGDASFDNPSQRKLTEIGRRLAERHAIVKDFFKNTLPDLVVPTQFVVGARAGLGKDAKRLYEIQNLVKSAVSIDDDSAYAWEYMENDPKHPYSEAGLRNLLKRISREAAEKIYNEMPDANRRNGLIAQIEVLTARAREFAKETGWIPYDLFKPDNLLMTKDGLRFIDTNMGSSHSKFPKNEEVFNRGIKFWEAVAEELKAMEAEEVRKAA